MKKILSAILLLATFLTLFTACAKDGTLGKKRLDFKEVYNAAYQTKEKVFHAVSAFTLPEGAVEHGTKGNFYHYSLNGKHCFYHVKYDRVVVEVEESEIASADDIVGNDDILTVVRTTSDGKKLSVYGENGTLLAESKNKNTFFFQRENFHFDSFYSSWDSFTLDGKFYVIEDGVCKNVYTLPPLLDIDDLCYLSGDYIVKETDNNITFYDKNGNEIYSYTSPIYRAGRISLFLFAGNALVQYTILCDVDKECDYITSDGMRYRLSHVLLQPDKKKAKELDLGVFITDISTPEERESKGEDYYTDAVSNVLTYYTIREKILDSYASYAVLLNDDGTFGASLHGYAEGQASPVTPLKNGMFYAQTESGSVVFDTEGNIIRKLASDFEVTDFGYKYGNMIYDDNFEPVLDLSGPAYYGVTSVKSGAAVFYRKNGNYYRYDKTGEHLIKASNGAAVLSLSYYDSFYAVEYSPSSYDLMDIYTYDGTYLFTCREYGYYTVLSRSEDALLVSYNDVNGKSCYVRITK